MRSRLLMSLFILGGLVIASMAYAMTRPSHTSQDAKPSSGAITGRVLGSDGRPVPEARVYAMKSDFTMGRLRVFPTDEMGMFSIEDLSPGTYRVAASKEDDDYPPTDSPFHNAGVVEVPQVTVYEGQTTSGVIVQLGPKAAKLIGRVVDAVSKKPIAPPVQGIQIILQRVDEPGSSYATSPNIAGEFSILIPPVPIAVEVSAPGYEKRHVGSLHLKREETNHLDIALRPDK